jgi:hypothetical protein
MGREDFLAVGAEQDGCYLRGGAERVEAGAGGCIPDVHCGVVCSAA